MKGTLVLSAATALGLWSLAAVGFASETYVTELGRYPLTVTAQRVSTHRATVRADMTMPAPPETLWAILTDYDHLAEFIPLLKTSRAKREGTGSALLTQRGVIQMALYRQPLQAVFRIHEEPLRSVSFEAIEGDFLIYRGRWQIAPTKDGSHLSYEAEIEPAIRIPSWVISQLERGLIKATFRAILRRCQHNPA